MNSQIPTVLRALPTVTDVTVRTPKFAMNVQLATVNPLQTASATSAQLVTFPIPKV